MNRTLITKSIREGSALFAACSLGLIAFTFFRVWIVGRFDSNRFKQLIDILPKDWDRYTSVDFTWLVSYLGRVTMTLDEPMLLMMIALWGIVRGSDVVSGELGRGTLEIVLAQPIRRSNVYYAHVFVSLFGALILTLLVWGTMAVAIQWTMIKESTFPAIKIPLTNYAIPLTFREPIESWVAMRDYLNAIMFWPGIVNLFCLSAFFVALTSFLSACDRYRWRTLGVAVGFYFVMAMLKFGGLATDSLRFLLYFTIFHLYEPELQVRLYQDGDASFWSLWRWNEKLSLYELGPCGANILLLLISTALIIAGVRIFKHRDIPAPV